MDDRVFIQPDFSLLVLLLGFPILILLAKRSRFVLASFVFLFCVGMFFVGLSWKVTPPVEALPSTVEASNHSELESIATPRSTDHHASLDALWEKLTEAQINLSQQSDEQEDALPNAEDKEATQAVSETFGLDDEGNLPPQWVIIPPKAVGNVYRQSVASDPFVTVDECREQLETELLPRVVSRRIEQLVSGDVGHPVRVDSPLPLGIGLDYIFREICVDEFTGMVDSSVGEMKKVHVLLEFNDSIDGELRNAWLQHERNTRLQVFGTYALIAIAVLAAIYGLLRIDTWTRGYYSQQLLWGSAVAIIVMVFLLVN